PLGGRPHGPHGRHGRGPGGRHAHPTGQGPRGSALHGLLRRGPVRAGDPGRVRLIGGFPTRFGGRYPWGGGLRCVRVEARRATLPPHPSAHSCSVGFHDTSRSHRVACL